MPLGRSSPNRILSQLEPTDFQLVEPHLTAVDLPLRKVLVERGKRITNVYFIESGVASVVADGGQPIEVGIIGREGMSDVSIVMGVNSPAVHDTYMQIAGTGLCMPANDLRQAIAASTTFHAVLLHFAHSFMALAAQTALANGRGNIEQRLARWLLLARDRVDDDDLPLTHEFLAVMLGVRRSGVTIALQELMRKGMITYRRSVITIADRDALEHATHGIYSPPDDKY